MGLIGVSKIVILTLKVKALFLKLKLDLRLCNTFKV